MTVGEAIAQARDAAGLSVDEVSGRTGIRETVIRDIERDDFAALGGDLYVRGYLRAIAAAVGLDP
ncbi:MAG TPA: helix-turn-helix domain-containing protein, partial [Trebonia sp.]